ncbi:MULTISPECIES: hypothetical protein [unclassified Helicobacter]|uniref:hypothetical protein n=1 Tax=unclassified Helicobacter TaxID=2593540 RepID=UPI0012E840C3|nr:MULTISPECIES: hypothetical protein [unclassified Helicobacter]
MKNKIAESKICARLWLASLLALDSASLDSGGFADSRIFVLPESKNMQRLIL